MAKISLRLNQNDEKMINILSEYYKKDKSALIKYSIKKLYEDIEDIIDKQVISEYEAKEKNEKIKVIDSNEIIHTMTTVTNNEELEKVFKIGIVGTRKFDNYTKFKDLVMPVLAEYKYDTIVSGGALGIDSLAKKLAHELNINLIEFLPGNKSPLKRNTRIAFTCDILIAMPDGQSTGTYDTIRKATKMGKKVVKIKV